ncbi:transmembrane protein 26-like [Dendronephthya gigantea]|uniref:transmembrane protein 26-like n=1 Tax=Dendronephthya gigantea TaxID=151771 RepID=UPI00106CA464|nr:transmembrane protein 26-like [Dendronephthya gigantea]
MSLFFRIFNAVFTRALFVTHAILTLVKLREVHEIKFGYIVLYCFGLLLLVSESVYTLIRRKGLEYKYVWPGGLCYLLTILSLIWAVEMAMLEDQNENSFEFSQKFSELGLIIVIITGRWLLPRGKITRDQLSALLLTYVGTAADIMELFEVFDDKKELRLNKDLYIAVLCTYTWSVLQFAFVRTATAETVADHDPLRETKMEVKNMRGRSRTLSQTAGKDHETPNKVALNRSMPKYLHKLVKKSRAHNQKRLLEAYRLEDEEIRTRNKLLLKLREEQLRELQKAKKSRFHGDLYNILVGIFMMDAPFLILRLIMIFKFGVTTDLHLLFTGKNAIGVSLLIYRLCILTCAYN